MTDEMFLITIIGFCLGGLLYIVKRLEKRITALEKGKK
jgi:hypothetical protein